MPARSPEREVFEIDHDALRKTFEEFDLDHSGAVDFEELEAMVTSMGMILEPAELYDMLHLLKTAPRAPHKRRRTTPHTTCDALYAMLYILSGNRGPPPTCGTPSAELPL